MGEMKEFFLSKKEITLKDVFDNVRNYAIAAIFLSMAFWFRSGKATYPTLLFDAPPKYGWDSYGWVCIVVFGLLFCANACQSFLMINRFFHFLFKSEKVVKVNDNGAVKLAWWKELFVKVVAVIVVAIFVNFFLVIGILVVYISWFAAIGVK
jgi:hypothetical protein